MRLAPFIKENSPQIKEQWESFARTFIPAAEGMGPLGLRNHIAQILDFITDDIETYQSETEQTKKSHGEKAKLCGESAAETHASLRQAGGFNMNQMVSEFRALRASVARLWAKQIPETEATDISDLTRFNESIDQAMTESIAYYTAKIDRSKDLFLGILSHDLRNPIGSMRMSAQLASKIGPLNERQTMLISQVVTSAQRATEILDHLVELTRARLGSGMHVIRNEMDMAFVARQIVDEMRNLHPDRKFNLKIEGQTEGSWDRPRIGQVLSNLLGNAVQYGFTDLPINTSVLGDENEVTISVHNDGVPIPRDELGAIFESMTRGAESPGSLNLGLGLYITKEIVAAHGGRVGVTSSEKEGTTFVAHFPRK